jgi:O-glycosyl hydrolase
MKYKSFLIISFITIPLFSQETAKIDIYKKYQKFEGWGVSLSWWANIVGREFTDQQIDTLCNWLTDPNELDMNIFRFNIGGGDNPTHHHMRLDAQMPGYKPEENAPYNWNADEYQRKILLKIKQLQKNALFEAASYSPPYWMTKSGCSSGNFDGSDNLKENYYGQFADYLTEVVSYYRNKYGIIFRTISPVNEPFSNWWKEFGSQEGCAFSQNNQEQIIKELYNSLKKKNMLRFTTISAMDANSIDECYAGIKGYENQRNLLKMISQINTHSYAGSKRKELANLTVKHRLRLWQSESGPLLVKKQGIDNYLLMAKRIIIDLNEMHADTWCDWQYMSEGFNTVWGLVGFDSKTKTFRKNKGYYCRMQFSKFILPEYFIVEAGNENVLAAYSNKNKKLVVVVVNDKAEHEEINMVLPIQLDFNKSKCYETTEDKNCIPNQDLVFKLRDKKILSLSAKSVVTFVCELQ